MKNSIADNLTDQQKVSEPFALALAAGFSEAARNSFHGTASATCVKVEPVSLRTLLNPPAAVIGMEIRFDAGISGGSLLLASKADLALLGELLSEQPAPKDGSIAPQAMDACLKFFAGAMAAAGKNFAQSCGLAISGPAPKLANPAGNPEGLLPLADAYDHALCLTFEIKVESRFDKRLLFLMHTDLLASLNAQLPGYASAASGAPSSARSAARQRADAGADPQQARWNIDLILDVELDVAVSFGEAQMPLRDVLKLGVGSVIELEKGVNDPVTILVNEKPIARGEVVMVDGNYGVKVLEVESTADRIRSLG